MNLRAVVRLSNIKIFRRKTFFTILRIAIGSGLIQGCSVDEQSFSSIEVLKQGLATQKAKLLASDGDADDCFGESVAISGNTAVVGASNDEPNGNSSGSVYVYVRSGTAWTQQQKLTANDSTPFSYFGKQVSIDGDTVCIGAPYDDVIGYDSGSAYIFVRSGTVWSQQQKLLPIDNSQGIGFGWDIDVARDTCVIGAVNNSAYVFTRSGTTWSQQQKLTGGINDWLGNAVSISSSSDTILTGNGGNAAYMFVRAGTTWSQQQKLTGSDSEAGDFFGFLVSVDGNLAVVGAPWDSNQGGSAYQYGSAYVFSRSGTVWTEETKLSAIGADYGSYFGYAISLSGNTVVVSSEGGNAYVFDRVGTSWTEQQHIGGLAVHANLGFSIDVDGNKIIAGAPSDSQLGENSGSTFIFDRFGPTWKSNHGEQKLFSLTENIYPHAIAQTNDTIFIGTPINNGAVASSGAVHVYEKNGSLWNETSPLVASDGASWDRFGISVSAHNDVAIIGSLYDDDHAEDSGSAYIFVRNTIGWVEFQKVTAPDGVTWDRFGESVSIYQDTAIVGAPGASGGQGAAYLFERIGTTWLQSEKLTGANSFEFGRSVALNGDTMMIGDFQSTIDWHGRVHLFVRGETGWYPTQELIGSNPTSEDNFGNAIAVEGNLAVIGASSDNNFGTYSGAAYIFGRTGTTWSQQQKLFSPNAIMYESFGNSVAISGNVTLVGAPIYANPHHHGAAYSYVRSGSSWNYHRTLTPSDDVEFGAPVSVMGTTAVVGRPQENYWNETSGYAYVFDLFPKFDPELELPVPGKKLTQSIVTFEWSNNGTPVEEYWLYVGNSYASANLFNSGSLSSSTLSQTVSGLPTDGRTLFVRLWYKEAGTWKSRDYTYTAEGTQPTPSMVSPTVGTILNGSSVTFSWTSNGATACNWWLYAGSLQGFKNIHDSGSLSSETTYYLVGGLPLNGNALWIRLWYGCSGVWKYVDAQYTSSIPSMESPVSGSTLSGSSETFTWNDNGWGSEMWWLYVGSTQGASNYHDSGWIKNAATVTRIVNGLPTNGSAVWVRLWFKKLSTGWQFKDVHYVSSN